MAITFQEHQIVHVERLFGEFKCDIPVKDEARRITFVFLLLHSSKDVIKRDIDAGSFYPYRLQKVQTNNLLSDIDPSCSPGFCGINFKAFDFKSPFCWLKLTVLSILAGYVASYLLERLFLSIKRQSIWMQHLPLAG